MSSVALAGCSRRENNPGRIQVFALRLGFWLHGWMVCLAGLWFW